MKLDKKHLGQVFTSDEIVNKMCSLIKNGNEILEPSCGDGAFLKALKGRNLTAIELDSSVAHKDADIMDFFDYSTSNKFDTIIGNPPYVKYNDIDKETKNKLKHFSSLFDKRSNLFLFFIYKCTIHLKDGGEIIFITPRELFHLTSSKNLNRWLYELGTITDYVDLGEQRVFKNAEPNCVIWRFEKGNFSRITNGNLIFTLNEGIISFNSSNDLVPLGDLFSVKVGGVSGANDLYSHPDGNLDLVYSRTNQTGKTRKMFYNILHPELEKNRDEIIKRRGLKEGDESWYKWERGYHISDRERIYVNTHTRHSKPFFYHKTKAYDGSILALFPKFKYKKIEAIADILNMLDWREMGFLCGARYIFRQRSLENSLIPRDVAKKLQNKI